MTLRFHKKIYSRAAVKSAVETYGAVASVAMRIEGDYAVVEVEADSPEDTAEVAGELQNWALGQAIVLRGEG
jgi:hypothetical protein